MSGPAGATPTRSDKRRREPAPDEMESLSLIREFLLFARENKKWWIVPIVVILLLLGTVMLIGETSIAPYIYTIF